MAKRLTNDKKRRIIISESAFNRLLLKEDYLGKQLAKARRVLRANGYSDEDSTKQVQEWENISYLRKNDGFGLPGYARLYVNGEITDEKVKNSVLQIIDLIYQNYKDSIGSDLSLNGKVLTANELISKFGEEVKERLTQSSSNANKVKNERYKFYRISNFNDAEEWSNYVPWCITKDARMYDSETNNGSGIFVFCVRDDFNSTMKETTNEQPPYDDYGLSMIAVCIEHDGSVYSCTSRWNHSQGRDGALFDRQGLENLFGIDFEEVFYPRTEEEPYRDESMSYEEWLQVLRRDAVWITDKICLSQRYDNQDMRLEENGRYAICQWDEDYGEPSIISDFEFEKDSKFKIYGKILVIQSIDETYYAYGYENRMGSDLLEEVLYEFNSYTVKNDILIADDGDELQMINIKSGKKLDTDSYRYNSYDFHLVFTNGGGKMFLELWNDSVPEMKDIYDLNLTMLVGDVITLDGEEHINTVQTKKYGWVIKCINGDDESEIVYIDPIYGKILSRVPRNNDTLEESINYISDFVFEQVKRRLLE